MSHWQACGMMLSFLGAAGVLVLVCDIYLTIREHLRPAGDEGLLPHDHGKK
jgi:hypothetical protein